MKRLLLCLLATMFLFVLFGCEQLSKYTIEFKMPDFLKKTTEVSNKTEAKETDNKTTEIKDADNKTTENKETNYGTESAPITAGEAIGIVMGEISPSAYSSQKAYVTGVVDSVSYSSKYASYTMYIKTDAESSALFEIFSGTLKDGVTAPHKGDTVVASGYLYNYNGQSAEMAGSSDPVVEYPTVIKVIHSLRTIEIGSHENAEVELSKTEAICGETVTVTVTPNSGYEIEMVKAGGTIIKANEGVYSFEVTGDTTITVVAVIEGTAKEKGTIDNPFSVSEAREIADGLLSGAYSTDKYYVCGTLKSNTLNTQTNSSYNLVIVDTENNDLTLDVYSSTFEDKNETVHIGDYVVVYGNLYIFNNTTYEMTGSSKVTPKVTYPKISKVEHQTKTITLGDHENATVTDLPETAKCGDYINFNIVVNEGFKVKSVKANDTNVSGANGEYSFTLAGNTVITVEVCEAGEITTIGTLEEPLSVTEAIAEIDKLTAGTLSNEEAYVKGIVDSVSGPNTYDGYVITVHDEDDETATMQFYSIRINDSLGGVHVGDTVIGLGHLQVFVGYSSKTYELSGDEEKNVDFPSMQVVEHQERTITTVISNGTVSGIPATAYCGDVIEFTVAVNEGCTLSKVFVNSVLLTAEDEVYSFEITDDTTIDIRILGAGEEEKTPTKVTKTIETIASECSWEGKDSKGNAHIYESFEFDDVVTISSGTTGSRSNTGKYYPATSSTAPTWRIYSSEGGYITITVAEGYELTGFSYSMSEGALKDYDADTLYTISGNTITISASKKTFITGFTIQYVEADK